MRFGGNDRIDAGEYVAVRPGHADGPSGGLFR
jgi:hypothetical protein